MRTAKDWRAAGLRALVLVAALLLSSCGGKVSARGPVKVVTQWKYTPKTTMGVPKGLIIEQQGGEVKAIFCDLADANGFSPQSSLAQGTYLADRRVIVFPLGMPESANVEEWVRAGGVHLAVPWDANATELHGVLASHGSQQSFDFALLR